MIWIAKDIIDKDDGPIIRYIEVSAGNDKWACALRIKRFPDGRLKNLDDTHYCKGVFTVFGERQ